MIYSILIFLGDVTDWTWEMIDLDLVGALIWYLVVCCFIMSESIVDVINGVEACIYWCNPCK